MKVICIVLSLFILLAFSSLTACAGEKADFNWNDIPVYPGAELELTRTWSVLPEEEPFSEVEWRYYLAGDKYSVSEVVSFYESEMPAIGWQEALEPETLGILEVIWKYNEKINHYVPADIVKRLNSWGYYSKNDGIDWAALWMGINKDWEEADKTYIIIMLAK